MGSKVEGPRWLVALRDVHALLAQESGGILGGSARPTQSLQSVDPSAREKGKGREPTPSGRPQSCKASMGTGVPRGGILPCST